MDRTSDHNGFQRRGFLKGAAGAVGIGSIAGCLGGSDGGDTSAPGADGQMVMTTSTETTSAYSMSQVIANRVSQNSDVSVEARPSEGTNANIGRLERDESDIVYVQNWTASKIEEGADPFGDLSYTPYQVFHLYDLAWFLCTANEGWETVADIESGARVSPTPRGSGTAEMLEHALGYQTEDYERVSMDYGEQGGAMNEGRLDVGAGTWVNNAVETGWLEQMKGTVDLRVLQWPDEILSDLQDDPSIIMSQVDTADFDGYGYLPDTLNTPALAYNFVVRDDFHEETLRSFLETLWENRDGLGDDNALLGPMEDGEFWTTNGYETLPFHPVAAEFYQDKGVWNDDYDVGD